MKEKEIKKRLLLDSEEFGQMFEQHQKLDEELEALKKKPFLSEAEKAAEREIKKRKLRLKDQMYNIISEYKKHLS
ncbi:DUF465 domain-containing protein [Acidobacteriota bacterium]